MPKSIFSAATILIGTVIGAGIFGVPYALSKIGYIPGVLYLIIIGVINLLVFLCYGEVVERSKDDHQMTGHAERYLGSKGKSAMAFTMIFGSLGALLVYLIGIGDFTYTLLGESIGGSPFLYSSLFFIVASLVILAGLGMIVWFERVMVVVLMLIVILFLIFGLPHISIDNLLYTDFSNLFLPYGVLLFAFGGVSAIPEMYRFLSKKNGGLKKSIYIGTIIPLVLYIVFALAIVGVSGRETTSEAVEGLSRFLGGGIVALGAILGIFTMGTSFLTLGHIAKQLLMKDYKLNKILAWVLVCFIPYIIYLLGLTNFIEVIGIVGSVTGGLYGILVLLMYRKARRENVGKPKLTIKLPTFVHYLLLFVFVLGIVYEIIFLFQK
ncbi:hypothetical protein KKH43_06495 [Patescibacteria group bacterium]|nr:hypothetical protein [Patescibacteria group bacterium]